MACMRRPHRLRHKADIGRLHRQGKRWHTPYFVMIVSHNKLPLSRFAFAASRHIGNAVKRNRAKRLLREAVRHQWSAIDPGWDCLFLARTGLHDASLADVETLVARTLFRAGLIDEKPPKPRSLHKQL